MCAHSDGQAATFKISNLMAGDAVLASPVTSAGEWIKYRIALGLAGTPKLIVECHDFDDIPDKGTVRATDASYIYSSKKHLDNQCVCLQLHETIGQNLTGCDCFFPLIDCYALSNTLSVPIKYTHNAQLMVRVRGNGMRPFQTTAHFNGNSVEVASVRISDTVVDAKKKGISGLFFVRQWADGWTTCTPKDIYDQACEVCIAIFIRGSYAIVDNTKSIVESFRFDTFWSHIDLNAINIDAATTTPQRFAFRRER